MRQNLVYIGSSTSEAALKKVVTKLETVLSLLSSKIKVLTHSILPEGPGDVRLAYRWLHRIGLHQATFAVPCGNLTIANEYTLLLNAAAIRMEKKNKFGHWVPDETVYPLQNALKANVGQRFQVFKNFHPRSKPRFADIRPVPYGPQSAAKEVSAPEKLQEPKPKAGVMESAVLEQGAEGCHGSPGPELNDGGDVPIFQRLPALDRQVYTSAVREKSSAELVLRSRFVETLLQNPPPPQSIPDWVEGIEDAAQSESEMNDFIQDEPLISFDESSKESQCGSEAFNAMELSPIDDGLRKLHKGIMQIDQFEQSDDLIMLDNEPEASRVNIVQASVNGLSNTCLLSGEIPQIENVFCPVLDNDSIMMDEGNPLEAREMNVFSDSLVRFGLMEEKPREVYRTMNQKTGRTNSKVTKGPVPHQPEDDTQHQNNLMREGIELARNRRLEEEARKEAARRERIQKKLDALGPPTLGERPTTRAPAKRGPNPVSEDEFPPLGGGPSSSKKQVRRLVLYADAAKLSSSRTQQERRKVANLQATNEQLQPLSTEIFLSTCDRSKNKSKEPRDKIPDNHLDYAAPQKSDVLRHSEDRLKAMSQILEHSPGHISLEVIFGRIYIKKLAPSMVKDSASEYSYQSVTEAVNFLNGSKFPPDCVGFSPILSTMGGDADLLANITPPGDLPWRLTEREIWYDFQCKLPDTRDESFVLELNAKTFQYRCRGPRKELFSMYMHCPGRAWDMKAYGARSSALGGEARFVKFAASLFEQMAIYVDANNGNVTIEFFENSDVHTAVKNITMRQVAKFRHQGKADSSLLSIAMKHILKEGISPVMCDRNRMKIAERRKFITPDGSASSDLPHQYMEASITSSRLSPLFEENVQLESGNKTAWDMGLLEGQGVFGDILRPAFGMVTHMDSIGASNNTRRYVSNHDPFHEPAVVSAGKKKKIEFW
ncbi:hypothetical protein TGAMA5MH_05296 [Trichoderma gamsii]|uniref:Uncharacterized protein n=1 Tax=Trichoderma gamsii TaxID=398673 RepID=A0A2K0TAK8_9HYPO|nr:hypothetical protein TGAMA5MH_05296 [Trichoderma gamsii]